LANLISAGVCAILFLRFERAAAASKRHPGAGQRLDPANSDPLGPLTWFDDSEDDDWVADWWPADYVRPDTLSAT